MNGGSKFRSKKVAVCTKKLPPCNNICPAGEDIRRWISLAKKNKFHQAWEVITQSNPFPAIHGRVCYHHCETRCNRIQYDEKVSVHCIERFLGDLALTENWPAPVGKEKTNKKVLVVGAGPAGLSAAYYLHLMGIDVTIYEALPKPGGMMLVGIPSYRLPREILSKEIKRVLDTGIKIEYNRMVDDILLEKENGNFDAVFLGIGAHLGKNVVLKTENPCQMLDAVEYLKKIAFNEPITIGKHLVVYGGGNTAIDVARTAKRLGVSDVTVVYHRTRGKMSAFPQEFVDASAEGIKFTFLRSITEVNGNKLTLSINKLDEKGRAKHTGDTEIINADTLIFALSQIPDSEFLRKVPEIEVQSKGAVEVDRSFMTGYRGIFAGGNMIPYDRSVTFAVGHGRKAANHINAYLNNVGFVSDPPAIELTPSNAYLDDAALRDPKPLELVPFEYLHIDDKKSKATKQKTLDVNTRIKSFNEVEFGIEKDAALYETKRCFSCGNCFGCGKCYAICPVNAIIHSESDGRVTSIDPEKCIGCGKCFKVCPCGAISMVDR